MHKLLTKKEIEKILSDRFKDDRFTSLSLLPSPYLLKDIKKAAKRIVKALDEKEKIVVVGDYDADGVISSFILSDFLERVGASCEIIIPNRFDDGYGISLDIIKNITAPLIVTVDNGISAIDAAKECQNRGIDLIITDHHTVPQNLPEAFAIVNPKQCDCKFPYKEICGAEVAWYLVAAIKNEMGIDFKLMEYLDLLSIAIVADMMDLKELNRVLVKKGLELLNRSKRVAIEAIKMRFEKDYFVSEDISYLLAPLLNSPGRMESATLSLEFLKSRDIDKALRYLDEIISLNEKRKEIEKDLFETAKDQIDNEDTIIVVWGENWHEGVIGIVAARLARRYKKPAIVFSISKDIAKGSARSIAEVDILSLIERAKEFLLKYGGHKGAAGLALRANDLKKFKDVVQNAAKKIDKKCFEVKREVLGEIEPSQIDFELLEILERFEPYGQSNPKPYFCIKNAKVKKSRILGKEQNHQKLILESNSSILESIDFNFEKEAQLGSKVDVIFSISKNYFRGYITPQLHIEFIK